MWPFRRKRKSQICLPTFYTPLPNIGQKSGREWDALMVDLEGWCFHVLQDRQRANIPVAPGDNNLSLLINNDALQGNPNARVLIDNRLLRIRLTGAYMMGGKSGMQNAYAEINTAAEEVLSIVQPTLEKNAVLPISQEHQKTLGRIGTPDRPFSLAGLAAMCRHCRFLGEHHYKYPQANDAVRDQIWNWMGGGGSNRNA